jgi:hypothetical protein
MEMRVVSPDVWTERGAGAWTRGVRTGGRRRGEGGGEEERRRGGRGGRGG